MAPEIPIERFEVFAGGVDHPECVAFDREGFLWAGGEAGQVYRIDSSGKVQTIAALGGFSGGIALSLDDSECFVCNPALGMVAVKRDGTHRIFATHAKERKLICPNFPVFDRAGNLYVSDSGNWKKNNGCLVRFDPKGNGEIIGGPMGYANGLALSADEKWLFTVESDFDRVWRMNLASGTREIYLERAGRMPDGLALDINGDLYVSCYASDEIWRVTTKGDRTLFAWDRWAILLSRPTNMAFKDDWMYIANLGRTTITRARVGVFGQKLVNLR